MLHTWFYLAMAHHRLGHADAARRWLEKAMQGTEEALKLPSETLGKSGNADGVIPPNWHRRLTLPAAASRGGTTDSRSGDEAREVTLTRKANRTRPKKSHRGFRLRRRMGMVSGHTYDAANPQ